MQKPALIALLACAASGCATLPDVTVTYYAPKSRTSITITQSMDCNRDHTAIFVVNAVSATTTFVADRTRPYQIGYREFDKTFADVDMAIALTDDGRLKSINANSTGQAEAVLKSAATFALEVIAVAAPSGFKEDAPRRRPRLPECDVIAAWGNNKGVTLVYGGALDNGTPKDDGALTVDPGSRDLYDRLKSKLPAFQARTASPTAVSSPIGLGPASRDDSVWLKFPNAARAKVEVVSLASPDPIWSGSVPVTVAGDYSLPIPKPALFGKQTFSLALSDSGGIATLGYGKGAGTAGALNAGSAILATHETAAEQAALLKAQADLIAQTQRLARCQAKPDTCT